MASSVGRERKYIACGPNGNNLEWTRRFFEKWNDVVEGISCPLYGYAAHYYCGTTGDALRFDESQWYEQLRKGSLMEELVLQQRAQMDLSDPDRRIGLIIDEWGCWHPEGSGPSAGKNLFEQQSTMRDALVAAMTLNIFNNHCDIVVMANIAQLVNNLHSLFLAAGDKLVRTPNYHVFDFFKGHQNGLCLRTSIRGETLSFPTRTGREALGQVTCSASLSDRTLTVTLVNAHYSQPAEVEMNVEGATVSRQERQVHLCAADPHACNTFDDPDRVAPSTAPPGKGRAGNAITLPPGLPHVVGSPARVKGESAGVEQRAASASSP